MDWREENKLKQKAQEYYEKEFSYNQVYIQGYSDGYAKAIDDFAHQFKENLNQEFPSNYESTRPYFSLENARLLVDEIAEQMKAGGIDG